MVQIVEILPLEDKNLFIIHSKNMAAHVFGNKRSQGIWSRGIDLVLLEYSGQMCSGYSTKIGTFFIWFISWEWSEFPLSDPYFTAISTIN